MANPLLTRGVLPESVKMWRTRAIFAIVLGVVGGVALSGYAVWHQMLNGLARSGCNSGGCEGRLNADYEHYQSLLLLGLIIGGGLVVAGSTVVIVLRRGYRATS